jgi:hypothetical protein
MKRSIVLFSLILFVASCRPKPVIENLTYQNIIILSDMSNRIGNTVFPNKDTAIIKEIVNYFEKNCVKPGIKISDRSKIYFSTFTINNHTSVDIEKFDYSIKDKQSFVNSTGNYKNSGLKEMLIQFEDSVRLIYSKERNPGLDLISMLIEKINNENIIKKNHTIKIGNKEINLNYINTIYLFTDGYLEFSKNSNQNFYFGVPQIEKIRNYCLANKMNINEALSSNPNLGIPAYRSPLNSLINLHVLETHERDKNVSEINYKNGPGLRDNEILQAVWTKWANDSGFNNFLWAKY